MISDERDIAFAYIITSLILKGYVTKSEVTDIISESAYYRLINRLKGLGLIDKKGSVITPGKKLIEISEDIKLDVIKGK